MECRVHCSLIQLKIKERTTKISVNLFFFHHIKAELYKKLKLVKLWLSQSLPQSFRPASCIVSLSLLCSHIPHSPSYFPPIHHMPSDLPTFPHHLTALPICTPVPNPLISPAVTWAMLGLSHSRHILTSRGKKSTGVNTKDCSVLSQQFLPYTRRLFKDFKG